MRSIPSYLLLIFMIMFWIFRIVVAFCQSMGIDIGFKVLNMNMEIILLFVSLLSIGLVSKRKLIGAILYLISYSMYFGVDLYKTIIGIIRTKSNYNRLCKYNSIFFRNDTTNSCCI